MSHNGNKKQSQRDRRLLRAFRQLPLSAKLTHLMHPLGPPSPSSARTFYIIPPTGGKFRL